MDVVRSLRTSLRTLHLLAFGSLYGGVVFAPQASGLRSAWIATAATGACLLLLDLVREPVTLVQVRGVAALVKIALAAAFLAWPDHGLPLLSAAAVIGAVSSHMPSRYRYYSLLHGRHTGSSEKG